MTIKQFEKKITPEMEEKYMPKFNKYARYKGNGVYFIPGTNLYSDDTRDLFIMFVAANEKVYLNTKEKFI